MGLRVLIVEDHPAMRVALSTAVTVSGTGSVVGESGDGAEAVALAKDLDPDLVVLDVLLSSGGTGFAVCRSLKALPAAPRVLFYSVSNTSSDVAACFLSGADGFIHKTAPYGELVEGLRAVARGEAVRWVGAHDAGDHRLDDLPTAGLTPRELEVLALVLQRYTNAEISHKLSLSYQTTKNHVSSVLRKLGARSRHELLDPAPEGPQA
ncbi:MAG: response regulator transcription factor [Actinomycetota bacterium]|nr:response regulator transcription factor [Actinomycetota bacterium]